MIKSIHNSILNDKSGTYNIVSGKAVSIKKLAEQMILLSGEKLGIQYTGEKKGDIKYSQADISLAKKELMYSPRFELDRTKELLDL